MEKLNYSLTPEDIDPWMWAVQIGLAALVVKNLWSAGSYVYGRVRSLSSDY